MSGIDGMGHVGISSSVGTANTLKNVGSAAFNVAMNTATVAAGAFAGPAGSAAMAGLTGGISNAIGGGTQSSISSAVNTAVGAANQAAQTSAAGAADQMAKAQSQQMELFQLQLASNQMSETFKTLTNVAATKHESAKDAINNVRA
jgi:hypothetical protein